MGCAGDVVCNTITGTCEVVQTPIVTPTPEQPAMPISLTLQLERTVDGVRVTGHLSNRGDRPIFYLSGCSALCRPLFYRAISFRVDRSDGREVNLLTNEQPAGCSVRLYCPEFAQSVAPGESVDETFLIDGTSFDRDATSVEGDCGTCTNEHLEQGRYTVIATSAYSLDSDRVYSRTPAIQSTAQFDWP